MKLRALVVEDEWATRNYLVELLTASGSVEVVGAVADLEAARQALDSESVDVAFVDVQLVAGDGAHVGRAVVGHAHVANEQLDVVLDDADTDQ